MTPTDRVSTSGPIAVRGLGVTITAATLAILPATALMCMALLVVWMTDFGGGDLLPQWKIANRAVMLIGTLQIIAAILLVCRVAWWPVTLCCWAWDVLV